MGGSSHSAAASALGYQHQTWWALLELLQAGPKRPDAAISLELYDDVAWEQNGTATELLQIKHHQRGERALTDASVDVWSTLKVWIDTAVPADVEGPALVLITTQVASPGTAMAALRADSRDADFALSALEMAALESASGRTQQAREQFLALGPADRSAFLSRISVIDGSPRIDDVPALVRAQLQWALPTGHEDLFLAMVWRWWDEQSLELLQGRRQVVDVGMAQTAIAGLRDQFTRGTLPTVIELDGIDADTVAATYDSSPFVQQMRWLAYPPRNLQRAIIDYYRAHTQTIRWLDDDLIAVTELGRFEAELIDEWESEFEWMLVDIGPAADETSKQQAGTRLLRELTQRTGPCLRTKYHDAFFGRGQRHMLADAGRVGWHADFRERLQSLLLAKP